MSKSGFVNPIRKDERKRVWAALRSATPLDRIAKYLGIEEAELVGWLNSAECPPGWKDSYLYGQRERYRMSLKGLRPGEIALKMAEYDMDNPAYCRPARKR